MRYSIVTKDKTILSSHGYLILPLLQSKNDRDKKWHTMFITALRFYLASVDLWGPFTPNQRGNESENSHWAKANAETKKIREQVKGITEKMLNIKDNFHFRSVWSFVNLRWLNHFSPMFRANLFGNSSKNWHPLDYGAECHISNAIKLAVKTIKCNHTNFCIPFRIALKSMRNQCHGQRKSITPGKFVLVQFYFDICYF